MSVSNYKVFITPLFDNETYHAEDGFVGGIDITDYVQETGLSTISREVDKGDLDIGVYGFGNLTLSCINFDGRFNPPEIFNHRRNYFRFSRDRCKVLVKFYDKTGAESISFRGIINDEGSTQDWEKGIASILVIANDSILRKVRIPAGAIQDGISFSDGIKTILNNLKVTTVLNFDPLNVNVDLDLTVDNGAFFDIKNSRDGLNELLLASNSVVVIDIDNNVYVRSRTENANTPWKFYGESDLLGRTNIINIKEHNTGLQRAFNQVSVSDTVASHVKYVERFGLRNLELKFDWMTDPLKRAQVAKRIANTFAQPKQECKLTVKTDDAKTIALFDQVNIDYANRFAKSLNADHIPVYGVDKYGQCRYPIQEGSFKITPKITWKVIGIYHDTRNLRTTLKLRETGIADIDGFPPE